MLGHNQDFSVSALIEVTKKHAGLGVYWGNIGIMEKKMEATTL